VDEVEHLREVVTKVSSRQTEQKTEPTQPSPQRTETPIPTQRTVVVYRNAPAHPRWVSPAFWASSTLRSRHLRVLR
jgi:hypothetical protein